MPEAVILESKLSRPPIRPEHVARPQVSAALSRGRGRRLTLVAAPPGFGKSTALAAWAASDAAPTVAWLSLDEHDNDPATFLTYIVAAFQRVAPGIALNALAAMRTPGGDVVDLVVPNLLNALGGLDREVALVLEDVHVIADPDVHRALAWLIERAPAGVGFVISTRHDPAIPLGRLRASGELVELGADDLRFGDDETRTFLVDALGLDLEESDVQQLHARTEGWPAALYLAALSIRGRPDAAQRIERYSGDDRYLVDYLASEVLGRQPAELRAFLLRTSVLARLSGPLCDAVLERQGSADVLASLEAANLLVVPLDANREWFRYHHLFGELLRHELERTEPELVPQLHARAAAWDRGAGLIVDAARHSIAAGATDAVAELVADHYGRFVDQGQLATVIGWLEAIPERSVETDWLLGFAGAVVYAHAGRIDEADRWVEMARRAPEVIRNGHTAPGWLAAVDGYLRLLRGDIGGAVTMARQALATSEAADAVWALGPQMVLAPALWWAGGADDADRVLESVARTGRAVGDPATVVYALGNRAAIALDRGDAAAAEILVRDAADLIRRAELGDHPWSAMAQILDGRLRGGRREWAPAVAAIEAGLGLGERLAAWQLIAYGSLALAEVRHGQGDLAGARRLLARVRAILDVLPDPGDGRARLDRTEATLRLRARRDHGSASAPFWELSPREADVLRLLPSRLSQREIGGELYVSFHTVRTHVRVIFDKLGVGSRAEAVARARELGLIP